MNVVKLSEICDFVSGFAFPSESFSREEGIGLIRIRDIKHGQGTEIKFTGIYDKKYVIKSGDYLIGMDGEFRCYEWKGDDALLNQRVCKLKANEDELDARYFFYGINKYLKEIEDVTTFTTVKHISVRQIRDITFSLPSLEEQRRIVARLDAAFEKIDRAIELTKKNINNSDLLFGGLLNAAVGEDGGAEVSLLGDIADVEYGLTEKAKSEGSLRFVRITDINSDGFLKKDGAMYVDRARGSTRYTLRNHDLLVARTGATFGKVLYFNGAEPSVFASYLIRIKFNKSIHPKLFWYYAKTPQYWQQANSLAGGAAQPQFNGNALKRIKFPYPTNIEKQKGIVKELDGYHQSTLQLKGAYVKKIENLVSLKESLLTKAFSQGEVQ